MGWICKVCGTENDFSLKQCCACDAAPGERFIARERAAAAHEVKAYARSAARAARRYALLHNGGKPLRRFTNAVCGFSAAVVAGALAFSLTGDMPSPERMRAANQAIVFSVDSTAQWLQYSAQTRIATVVDRRSAILRINTGMRSARAASLPQPELTLSASYKRLSSNAAENSAALKRLRDLRRIGSAGADDLIAEFADAFSGDRAAALRSAAARQIASVRSRLEINAPNTEIRWNERVRRASGIKSFKAIWESLIDAFHRYTGL